MKTSSKFARNQRDGIHFLANSAPTNQQIPQTTQGLASFSARTIQLSRTAAFLNNRGRLSPTLTIESGRDAESKKDDAVMAARALQLREALSRCDNSGGEGPACPQDTLLSGEMQTEVHLTNAELKQLQLRMIALENLVTALLAEASERQLDLAGVLAAYIAPKQGFTPYHLTIHAARHMKHPPSERAQGDAACAVRVTTSPCIRELHGNSSGDSKTTRSTKDRQNPAIEVNQWPDSAGLL